MVADICQFLKKMSANIHSVRKGSTVFPTCKIVFLSVWNFHKEIWSLATALMMYVKVIQEKLSTAKEEQLWIPRQGQLI